MPDHTAAPRAATRRARVAAVLVAGVVALVPAAGAALAAVGTPTSGLPDGVGIRLLDVPVERAEDPRANDYVVDHAIPGGTVRRSVLVSNGTDEPLPLRLYGVPASATDGWVVDDAGGEPGPDELAAWIAVDPPELTLAPNATQDVEVTISVPSSAPSGEQYAVVVAEPPPVDGGGGVGVVSRVGLRVYLTVGAGAEPTSDFEIDTLTAARDGDGTPLVEVGVVNTGGRAIDVGGELLLESADGLLTAGPFETVIPNTLGPGADGSVLVALDPSLPAGPWTATATMRSGLLERAAAAVLTFPDDAGTSADPVDAERIEAQRRVLLPIALTLLLLSIVGLWFLVLLARRREDEEDEEQDGVGPGDASGTDERAGAGGAGAS